MRADWSAHNSVRRGRNNPPRDTALPAKRQRYHRRTDSTGRRYLHRGQPVPNRCEQRHHTLHALQARKQIRTERKRRRLGRPRRHGQGEHHRRPLLGKLEHRRMPVSVRRAQRHSAMVHSIAKPPGFGTLKGRPRLRRQLGRFGRDLPPQPAGTPREPRATPRPALHNPT